MEYQNVIEITGMIISVAAIIISVYTYYKSKRDTTYADLDGLYQDLLKLGIEHPEFLDPDNTSRYKEAFKIPEGLHQYETYAYIVWNIIETIYDRKDDVLFETWKPVLVTENKLHRTWFEDPKNHDKFKQEFRDWIFNNEWEKLPNKQKDSKAKRK